MTEYLEEILESADTDTIYIYISDEKEIDDLVRRFAD